MSLADHRAEGPELAIPLGRRASNKAEKLQRITASARALFVERGYERTTMRDIAAHARVGFGTVFDYAPSKRDLLFMLFNPELDRVLAQSHAEALNEHAYLDRLMALFAGHYRLYAREQELARSVLRELTFFREGVEAQKFLDHRARFVGAVSELTRDAIASGALAADDPDLVAQLIFGVFAWEIRRWLGASDPAAERGLASLNRLLALQVSGLARAV